MRLLPVVTWKYWGVSIPSKFLWTKGGKDGTFYVIIYKNMFIRKRGIDLWLNYIIDIAR
jgi:hypothetical protein